MAKRKEVLLRRQLHVLLFIGHSDNTRKDFYEIRDVVFSLPIEYVKTQHANVLREYKRKYNLQQDAEQMSLSF